MKIVELCLFVRESTKVNCFCCLCPKVRKSQLLAAREARGARTYTAMLFVAAPTQHTTLPLGADYARSARVCTELSPFHVAELRHERMHARY